MNYLPYIYFSDFSACDELFTLYLPLGLFGLWLIIYLPFTSRIFLLVMNYLPYIYFSDFSAGDELFTSIILRLVINYLPSRIFRLVMNYLPYIYFWDFLACNELFTLYLLLGFFSLWWIIYLQNCRLVMNYLPSLYFSLGCSIWTTFSAGCNIQSHYLLSIHVELKEIGMSNNAACLQF